MTNPPSKRTPEITTPPCRTTEQANDFYRLLMLFVRELKYPGSPVSFDYFLLTQALHQHAPRRTEVACRSCPGPYPCATVLAVALVSRFPIAWSPIELARAIPAVNGSRMLVEGDEITDDYGDEVVVYRRGSLGVWTQTNHGKGGRHVRAIGDDAAMCAHLVDGASQFAVGLADRDTEDELDVVRPAVGSARAWWQDRSHFAYLSDLRFNGVEAEGTDLGSPS